MTANRPVSASRRHLADAGQAYGSHFVRATRIGLRLIAAGGACMIHGLIPGVFTTRASRTIIRLHDEVAAAHPHSGKRTGEPMWLEFEI